MKRPKWKEGVDRGCEERCALKEQKRASAALFALELATHPAASSTSLAACHVRKGA